MFLDVFSTWYAEKMGQQSLQQSRAGVSQVQFRLSASHLWVRSPSGIPVVSWHLLAPWYNSAARSGWYL